VKFPALFLLLATCLAVSFLGCSEEAAAPVTSPSVVEKDAGQTNFGIPWNARIAYGTLTDTRDGQVYKTVQIGSQVWMAENLNYRQTTGKIDTIGICYDREVDSCAKYGRLYRWTEVMAGALSSKTVPSGVQGICPQGWHVPSDTEWVLLQAAADPSGAMDAIKLKSSNGWKPHFEKSGDGTDDFGFRALPAGAFDDYRGVEGGNHGHWWTATVGIERTMAVYDSNVNGANSPTYSQLSLRCVKD
jgi:uncharacterized protein (TIGR02145 family)